MAIENKAKSKRGKPLGNPRRGKIRFTKGGRCKRQSATYKVMREKYRATYNWSDGFTLLYSFEQSMRYLFGIFDLSDDRQRDDFAKQVSDLASQVHKQGVPKRRLRTAYIKACPGTRSSEVERADALAWARRIIK